MLDKDEFNEWCVRNNISEDARKLIERIRNSLPSRKVRSGTHNVIGFYPSIKMGFTLEFESHTVELPEIHRLEHDVSVLEYYCQPSPIKIAFFRDKRRLSFLYTPDIFVIRNDGAGWIECKAEDELPRLAEKWPNRYVHQRDGRWRCPPGEEYASTYGLSFWIVSSIEIDPTYYRNMIFLDDFLRERDKSVEPDFRDKVISLVSDDPGISLEKLIMSVGIERAGDIYRLIAFDYIYVDLFSTPLAERENVHFFKNMDIAQAHASINTHAFGSLSSLKSIRWVPDEYILWDGKQLKIVNIGETTTYLQGSADGIIKLSNEMIESLVKQGDLQAAETPHQDEASSAVYDAIRSANDRDTIAANKRLPLVRAYLQGNKPDNIIVPLRTIKRWASRYRKAEELHGDGYIGLIPRNSSKGPTLMKKKPRAQELAVEVIKEHYENVIQPSKKLAFGVYVIRCENEAVDPYCYKIFTNEINNRSLHGTTLRRKGKKSAYKFEQFYWQLHQAIPKHGDRPFEIVHIDHTEADIELISPAGINLGRPWITFLMDAYSRRILAFYISFHPPSSVSCMMVLRICVERHSRFPQIIVVDGGKEFSSVYFEQLLARYECIKKTRPASKPRFGSPCERMFGTTNTQFINTLMGNTQNTKNVRELTKETLPSRLAVWTLSEFTAAIEKYLHEIYDTTIHPALYKSPRDTFVSGNTWAGNRPGRMVMCNEAFLIFTLPHTPKGTAKVIPGKGIKVNSISYWCDAFRESGVENSSVPVRYDPLDIGIVYAYVNKRWQKCLSEYYQVFQSKSLREIRMVTEILRKQRRIIGGNFSADAKKLADFYLSNQQQQHKKVLMQRLKDVENKKLNQAPKKKGQLPQNVEKVLLFKSRQNIQQTPRCSAHDIKSYGEPE